MTETFPDMTFTLKYCDIQTVSYPVQKRTAYTIPKCLNNLLQKQYLLWLSCFPSKAVLRGLYDINLIIP